MKNSTKVLSVDAFRTTVRQEVEEICQASGWKFNDEQGRGFAFQRWVADLLCAHEGVDEDKVATFTTNDLKFDVIIEDDEQKSLYLPNKVRKH